MFITRLFVLATLFLSSASYAATAPSIAKDKKSGNFTRSLVLPAWIDKPASVPSTTRKDPMVMRLLETQAKVGSGDSALFINRAIQVNERALLDRIGQYGIDYFPAYQKLALHRVSIIRDGQVLDRLADTSIRHLQRETEIESGSYGGVETVQLLLKDVRVGDTLWLTYSITGSNPVFGKWSDTFTWEGLVPIELRRLSVQHAANRPLLWRQQGDGKQDMLTPAIEERAGQRYLRFEGLAIDAKQFDEGLPVEFIPFRILAFSEHADWQSVANWADALFPAVAPSPTLKAIVKPYAGLPPEAQAAAALHWVQREIRYFSVAMGENSHRPRAPATVLQSRYGDCKDKSYLLIALLQAMGIESKAVLVSARAPRLPSRGLASPIWFDHVIVRINIDGHHYFVDPTLTGQTAPLATLPAAMPGADGLLVDRTARTLLALPKAEPTLPVYEHLEHIVLTELEGQGTLELRLVHRQRAAEVARERYAATPSADIRKELLGYYEKNFPGVELVADWVIADNDKRNELELKASFRIPKPARRDENRYLVPFDTQVVRGALQVPAKLVRAAPFALPRGGNILRYRLVIDWADSVRAPFTGYVKRVDNPFFSLLEEQSVLGRRTDYLVEFRHRAEEAAPADMDNLNTEVKKLNNFVTGSLATSKAVQQNKVLNNLPLRTLFDAAHLHVEKRTGDKEAPWRIESDEECEPVLSNTIKLPGTEMPAIQQRLRANQAAGTLSNWERRCLAISKYADGQFNEAAAAMGKLMPAPGAVNYLDESFAWAHLYAGKPREALRIINDLVTSSLSLDSATRVRHAQAQQIALFQRSGTPLPKELQAMAGAMPDGPWPRPLLAYQVGALSQAQLLAHVYALPRDAHDIALPEAWYFIGQQQASQGDRVAARKAFSLAASRTMPEGSVRWNAMAALAALDGKNADLVAAQDAVKRKDLAGAHQALLRAAEAGVVSAQRMAAFNYLRGNGVTKDIATAVQLLERPATAGDSLAQTALGYALLFEAAFKDEARGLQWMQAAAAQGEAGALLEMGRRYQRGDGVAKDPAEGARLMTLAAVQHNTSAQAALGSLYQDGIGVAQDYASGMWWLLLAASHGNAEAENDLGYQYEKGLGVERNLAIAAEMYAASADKGYAVAQANLGYFYARGKGVGKDLAKALKLYRLAAEQGNAKAQLQIGWAYDTGLGVTADKEEATRWYKLAADKGSAQGQYNLGWNYEHGVGIAQDYAKAMYWYAKADEQGHAKAADSIADLHSHGRGVPRDQIQAVNFYLKSAIRGNHDAMNSLGLAYRDGEGAVRDLRAAADWFEKSAQAGNTDAQIRLAGLLTEEETLADKVTAYKWATISAATLPRTDPEHADAAAQVVKLQASMSAAELQLAQTQIDAWRKTQAQNK